MAIDTGKTPDELYVKNTGDSFILSEAKRKCPVCGEHTFGCIDITIPPYNGKYCLRCYAKWLSDNFPKLEE